MAKYKAILHAVIPSEEDGPMKLLGGTIDSFLDIDSDDLTALSDYLFAFFKDFMDEGLKEFRIELHELNSNGSYVLVGLKVAKSGSASVEVKTCDSDSEG